MGYVCYIIASHDRRRTYAGSTNNLVRRIKQHDRKIVGGARATTGFAPSQLLAVVRGFGSSRVDALRFEWRLKSHRNWFKNLRRISNPILRREKLLEEAMVWASIHLPNLRLTAEQYAA